PVELLLLESGDQVGGVIRTERRDGFLLEHGPDSFISEKPEGIELAKKVGLANELIETNSRHRRSFIVRRGRLHSVPEGFQLLAPSKLWPFATTSIFSLRGKLRIAMEMLVSSRSTSEEEDESVAQFVRRRLGQEALERMAQPMIGGIYTGDPENLSLKATMPRFVEMERKFGSVIKAMLNHRRATRENLNGTSGARYTLFLSFRDGMQMLTEAIVSRLNPSIIRLNTRVDALGFNSTNKLWTLELKSGGKLEADAICLAVPAYAAARLLRSTDEQLAIELESIPYASTATVNLGLRRSDIGHNLNGFGFVVPQIEHRKVIACSFSSVKFAGRAPDGHVLLRAFVGGALQPEMFELDEELIAKIVCDDLATLLQVKSAPLFVQVTKWNRSMAQYTIGHHDRVRRIDAKTDQLSGLQLAGNAYSGAGIPDCIRSGQQAADKLLQTIDI
ncbi:MAG: protoporphyrinogen oxidase, partial [Pyrinomonadaceae bacterium]